MRTQIRKLISGTAAALPGLGLAAGISTGAEAATPASNSVAVLMQSYDSSIGRIGGGW